MSFYGCNPIPKQYGHFAQAGQAFGQVAGAVAGYAVGRREEAKNLEKFDEMLEGPIATTKDGRQVLGEDNKTLQRAGGRRGEMFDALYKAYGEDESRLLEIDTIINRFYPKRREGTTYAEAKKAFEIGDERFREFLATATGERLKRERENKAYGEMRGKYEGTEVIPGKLNISQGPDREIGTSDRSPLSANQLRSNYTETLGGGAGGLLTMPTTPQEQPSQEAATRSIPMLGVTQDQNGKWTQDSGWTARQTLGLDEQKESSPPPVEPSYVSGGLVAGQRANPNRYSLDYTQPGGFTVEETPAMEKKVKRPWGERMATLAEYAARGDISEYQYKIEKDLLDKEYEQMTAAEKRKADAARAAAKDAWEKEKEANRQKRHDDNLAARKAAAASKKGREPKPEVGLDMLKKEEDAIQALAEKILSNGVTVETQGGKVRLVRRSGVVYNDTPEAQKAFAQIPKQQKELHRLLERYNNTFSQYEKEHPDHTQTRLDGKEFDEIIKATFNMNELSPSAKPKGLSADDIKKAVGDAEYKRLEKTAIAALKKDGIRNPTPTHVRLWIESNYKPKSVSFDTSGGGRGGETGISPGAQAVLAEHRINLDKLSEADRKKAVALAEKAAQKK